jgi:hypothetical protein
MSYLTLLQLVADEEEEDDDDAGAEIELGDEDSWVPSWTISVITCSLCASLTASFLAFYSDANDDDAEEEEDDDDGKILIVTAN